MPAHVCELSLLYYSVWVTFWPKYQTSIIEAYLKMWRSVFEALSPDVLLSYWYIQAIFLPRLTHKAKNYEALEIPAPFNSKLQRTYFILPTYI